MDSGFRNNYQQTDHNSKDGRVAGTECVFVERIEAIVQWMSFVPHDAGFERVATAAVLFEHRCVYVQPRVYTQTDRQTDAVSN